MRWSLAAPFPNANIVLNHFGALVKTTRNGLGAACLATIQYRGSIMSRILNIVVSRYFAFALAGAIFATTGALPSPSRSKSLASTEATAQSEQSKTNSQATTTNASTKGSE